jgi:RNA polymerase sigma-70 factor, ECF subfamily
MSPEDVIHTKASLGAEEDREVIRLVLAGQKDSFRTLVDKYTKQIFKVIHTMLPGTSSAEDLLQDIFVKAYSSLKSFRWESSFKTWLFTIAHNTCLNEIRRRKNSPTMTLEDEALDRESSSSMSANTVPATDEQVLKRLGMIESLGKLKHVERIILVYRFYHDLPPAEISAVLAMPEGTIRSHLSRAFERLREETKRT